MVIMFIYCAVLLHDHTIPEKSALIVSHLQSAYSFYPGEYRNECTFVALPFSFPCSLTCTLPVTCYCPSFPKLSAFVLIGSSHELLTQLQ